MAELIVFRHGETEWNRESRFQGALDSTLTECGRAQAVALGQLLQRLGVGPSTHSALTSPQGRAAETARLALAPLGHAARKDAALREIAMGAWTGRTRAEVDAGWPGPVGEGVLDFYSRCPGGETLGELAGRLDPLLRRIHRPTVIVTHGMTLRLLCTLALGRGLAHAEGIEVPQGSLARIRSGRLDILHPEEALPVPAAWR